MSLSKRPKFIVFTAILLTGIAFYFIYGFIQLGVMLQSQPEGEAISRLKQTEVWAPMLLFALAIPLFFVLSHALWYRKVYSKYCAIVFYLLLLLLGTVVFLGNSDTPNLIGAIIWCLPFTLAIYLIGFRKKVSLYFEKEL